MDGIMKRLFTMDIKDYDENWQRSKRPSARGIIEKGDKLALIHNIKYDYYAFPGGGIEEYESFEEALIREVREETGLTVIPESIEEFGSALRIQKSFVFENTIFEQENFYYICKVEDGVGNQQLEDYEEDAKLTLEYISPKEALKVNRFNDHGEKKDSVWIERESRIIELLISEKENR